MRAFVWEVNGMCLPFAGMVTSGLLLTVWIRNDTALILVLSYFQYASSNLPEKWYILSCKTLFTYVPVRVSLLKSHLKSKSQASQRRDRKILKVLNSAIWNKGSLKQTTSVVFNPMGFSAFFTKSRPLMKSNVVFRKDKKKKKKGLYKIRNMSGKLKSLSM